MTVVSLTDLATLLGDASADPALLESALAAAGDLFSRACGRHERPFALEEASREEVHDGTGSRELYLDYPIATLTSITVGTTLLDLTGLRYRAGQRRIVRVDGGLFGCVGDPLAVAVEYDAAADLPDSAKRAILNAAAILFRRGAPDGATGEQLGEYRVDYVSAYAGASGAMSLIEQDPAWREAVRVCAEPVIV